MKKNKNLMLLLAAGAAYWYFAIYLKKKKAGSPSSSNDIVVKEDFNTPNVPSIMKAQPRLRPLAYEPDVVSNNEVYNVKYTMSGYKRLGKVPNSI